MKRVLDSLVLLALLLGLTSVARAQDEITLLAPGPMRRALDPIVANYMMKSGAKVKITYGTGLSTRQSVAKGEALDVSLILPPYYAALAPGSVDRSTATTVTSFLMAIAVPKALPSRTSPRRKRSRRR